MPGRRAHSPANSPLSTSKSKRQRIESDPVSKSNLTQRSRPSASVFETPVDIYTSLKLKLLSFSVDIYCT